MNDPILQLARLVHLGPVSLGGLLHLGVHQYIPLPIEERVRSSLADLVAVDHLWDHGFLCVDLLLFAVFTDLLSLRLSSLPHGRAKIPQRWQVGVADQCLSPLVAEIAGCYLSGGRLPSCLGSQEVVHGLRLTEYAVALVRAHRLLSLLP